MELTRFDVYLVELEPTRGHEMQKIRPCLIISPDEMNHHIATVIIAPMTTRGRSYPYPHTLHISGQTGADRAGPNQNR